MIHTFVVVEKHQIRTLADIYQTAVRYVYFCMPFLDKLYERFTYLDVQIDPPFTDADFDDKNPAYKF